MILLIYMYKNKTYLARAVVEGSYAGLASAFQLFHFPAFFDDAHVHFFILRKKVWPGL